MRGKNRPIYIIAALVILVGAPQLNAEFLAVKAGKIYTVGKGILNNGVIIIKDGKIAEIGENIEIPWQAEILDLGEKIIIPGLVEAHAARGMSVNNEKNPLTPFVTVLDSLDSTHDAFLLALRMGVTTLNVMPGNATIMGGLGAVIKPKGLLVDDMIVMERSGLKISLEGAGAQTKMGIMAKIRRYFNETRTYMEKNEKESGGDKKMVATPGAFRSPQRIKYEITAEVLKGNLKAFIYCPEPSDILLAHELCESFKISPVYILGPACIKALDFIKEKKLEVIISPELMYYERDSLNRGFRVFEIAGRLFSQKIPFAFQSNPDKIEARGLLYSALKGIGQGMTQEEALRSITMHPARILGLDDLLGSLEKGKLANFVVLDKEPFVLPSLFVHKVYIEGKLSYDRDNDEELKELTGSFEIRSKK